MTQEKVSVVGFRVKKICNKFIIAALLSNGIENKIGIYKNEMSAEQTLAAMKALLNL